MLDLSMLCYVGFAEDKVAVFCIMCTASALSWTTLPIRARSLHTQRCTEAMHRMGHAQYL